MVKESLNYDDRLPGKTVAESHETATARPVENPKGSDASAQKDQIVSDTRAQLTNAGILPPKKD